MCGQQVLNTAGGRWRWQHRTETWVKLDVRRKWTPNVRKGSANFRQTGSGIKVRF